MKRIQKHFICNFLKYNEISALQCTNKTINNEIMNYNFIWKRSAEITLCKKIKLKKGHFKYLKNQLCMVRLKSIQNEIRRLNLNYLFENSMENTIYDLGYSYLFRYMNYSDVYKNRFKRFYKNIRSWCNDFDIIIYSKKNKSLQEILISYKKFLNIINNPQNKILNGIKEILISNE